MVGIVIVSHSRALAEALVHLVKQVANEEVPMAVAAGTGDDRQEFGTDAMEIMEAIQAVDNPDGVLVLMDLGSAILSAEMALEFMEPDVQERVRFCAAPLVEGAIAAGVQAGLGSDLETVCNEAKSALLPKAEQLGEIQQEAPAAGAGTESEDGRPWEEQVATLTNPHGLHARPAARFVQKAGSFQAEIQVLNQTRGKGPVTAKSLNALATLGAVQGDEILIRARGDEARPAVEALKQLVAENFGEASEAQAPTREPRPSGEPLEEGALQAVPVSEGYAIGPLYVYRPPTPEVPDYETEDPDAAWEQLEKALTVTRQAIQERRRTLTQTMGDAQASIFDAHLLILDDPELRAQARDLIYSERKNEAAAWNQAIEATAETYQALEDEYLKQRATDVLDVGRQVLSALAGKSSDGKIDLAEEVVLYAVELTPTQTAQLDMDKVLGIVTQAGGPTSHSAILARSMGIPAVAGVDPSIERLPAGTLIGLNGFEGALWIDPDSGRSGELRDLREAWLEKRRRLLKISKEPAITRDDYRVEVVANAGSSLDAETAAKNGAEGIGLLRTEFLFLTRETPPGEEEQLDALRHIGRAIGADRPVIVRTLDVGGDKPLPYIDLPEEENPFLGVRAIRLSLRRKDLFLTQLRAILRGGSDYNFKIMFPMVTGIDEVRQAKELLAEAHEELTREGKEHRWPISTGIMVETPAAAVLSPILAEEVDFFSIGTNDLTQYTMAAERGNPALSELSDALNPAVLRLIRMVVEAAHARNKWVGVCGELAGEALAIPVLVGLGVDELSMNPGSIPQAKAIIREMTLSGAEEVARTALQAATSIEVRKIAGQLIEALDIV